MRRSRSSFSPGTKSIFERDNIGSEGISLSVDVDEVDKHIEREPPTARDISVSWRYLNDSFSKPLTETVFSFGG